MAQWRAWPSQASTGPLLVTLLGHSSWPFERTATPQPMWCTPFPSYNTQQYPGMTTAVWSPYSGTPQWHQSQQAGVVPALPLSVFETVTMSQPQAAPVPHVTRQGQSSAIPTRAPTRTLLAASKGGYFPAPAVSGLVAGSPQHHSRHHDGFEEALTRTKPSLFNAAAASSRSALQAALPTPAVPRGQCTSAALQLHAQPASGTSSRLAVLGAAAQLFKHQVSRQPAAPTRHSTPTLKRARDSEQPVAPADSRQAGGDVTARGANSWPVAHTPADCGVGGGASDHLRADGVTTETQGDKTVGA